VKETKSGRPIAKELARPAAGGKRLLRQPANRVKESKLASGSRCFQASSGRPTTKQRTQPAVGGNVATTINGRKATLGDIKRKSGEIIHGTRKLGTRSKQQILDGSCATAPGHDGSQMSGKRALTACRKACVEPATGGEEVSPERESGKTISRPRKPSTTGKQQRSHGDVSTAPGHDGNQMSGNRSLAAGSEACIEPAAGGGEVSQDSMPSSVRERAKRFMFYGYVIRYREPHGQELRDYVEQRRQKKKSWTDAQWNSVMDDIVAEERWGLAPHGGSRRKGQGVIDTDEESSRPQTPPSKKPARLGAAVAGTQPAAGGDTEAQPAAAPNVAEAQPAAGGDAEAVPAGGGDVGAIRHPQEAASSATGGLLQGVNMGYKIIGAALGKGTFGTTYPALWLNGDRDAGGQLVVLKHIALTCPEKNTSCAKNRAKLKFWRL